ncbi:hypothetical protein HMN09_01157200 [Mycena chlorophos]|uniref:Uncharacterized protein n=1 Tax=Mycena chlorophos TaxID=658473 RepID=A0A8H6S8R6_MYCCL|nr:hypothetical protein HMN09_01157200 [Mycena chlorophos]
MHLPMPTYNIDDFIESIKHSSDWTFMAVYNNARRDDDSSVAELLNRFTSSTLVNNHFLRSDVGNYTFLLQSATQNYAELSVVGFVTHVSLGPYSDMFHKRPNMAPHKFIQSITVSGLDDERFQTSVVALRHIHTFLQQSGADIRAMDASPTFAGKYPTITATSRLMTPTQFNAIQPNQNAEDNRMFEPLEIPRAMDPAGHMANAIGSGAYEYTTDNQVLLFKLMTSDPHDTATWKFDPVHSPMEIAVGNLVEVTMSLKVAPFWQGRKILCSLLQVNRISTEASSAIMEKQDAAQTANQLSKLTLGDVGVKVGAPKRRAPSALGGIPKFAKRMDVDREG